MDFKEFVGKWHKATIVCFLTMSFLLATIAMFHWGMSYVCDNSGGILMKNMRNDRVFCMINTCQQCNDACDDICEPGENVYSVPGFI